MKNYGKYLIVAVAAVLCASVLARAYVYKFQQQETITVTGLGETQFESDLIVWTGYITAESQDVASGYAQIEKNKRLVAEFIASKGIPADAIVFEFVNVNKEYESVYAPQGGYMGQRFTGYSMRQRFTVESTDVDAVESVSREISSLIAKGVSMEAWEPAYYYTKLDDVKLDLIEKASQDARNRARKIAKNAGTSREGKLVSSLLGVFQITGSNSNEEYSAGGSFNTSSRQKKARVTIRAEHRIK